MDGGKIEQTDAVERERRDWRRKVGEDGVG
jgi:hypothetical protein